MSPLSQAVDEYLALRRGLGFSLRQPGAMLHQFAAFLERDGAPYITRELALRWAQQRAHAQPEQWASRLGVVRRFAQFWRASDPRTEVSPLGLLPHRYGRKPPYIYTEGEIRRLIAVARQLPSATRLRPATYATLLGLLAVTGLRISEALVAQPGRRRLVRGGAHHSPHQVRKVPPGPRPPLDATSAASAGRGRCASPRRIAPNPRARATGVRRPPRSCPRADG